MLELVLGEVYSSLLQSLFFGAERQCECWGWCWGRCTPRYYSRSSLFIGVEQRDSVSAGAGVRGGVLLVITVALLYL